MASFASKDVVPLMMAFQVRRVGMVTHEAGIEERLLHFREKWKRRILGTVGADLISVESRTCLELKQWRSRIWNRVVARLLVRVATVVVVVGWGRPVLGYRCRCGRTCSRCWVVVVPDVEHLRRECGQRDDASRPGEGNEWFFENFELYFTF